MDMVGKAIERMGGVSRLADALQMHPSVIYRWRRIPAERVIQVEHVTRIPREELRPDIFLAPRPPDMIGIIVETKNRRRRG